MKRLLFAWLLAYSLSASADPFAVSDVLTVGVSQCGVFLDTSAKVTIPVTAVTGGNICQYDLIGIPAGKHSLTMTAMTVGDPVFGTAESVQSLPLVFTKPGIPVAPSGLKLCGTKVC